MIPHFLTFRPLVLAAAPVPIEIAECWPAIGLALIGCIFQLLNRRLPRGLGTSVFVACTSVAAGYFLWRWRGLSAGNLGDACHILVGLCAVWAAFGWFSVRAKADHSPRTESGHSAFFAWALVTGVGAAVLIVNQLVRLTLLRVLNPWIVDHASLPASFAWDIGGLVLALLLWGASGSHHSQPTMLLIVAALAAWGSGLLIPLGDAAQSSLLPNWWDWVFQTQLALAAVLVLGAVTQDARYRARRRRAWPDSLDDLVEPYGRWPFYIQAESMIAVAVLMLAVYQLIQWESSGILHALATCLICLAAGATCSFMAYRRWSGITGALSLALLTVAGVWISYAVASAIPGGSMTGDYATRMPGLFNAMLFALTISIALWRWLAEVWRQQLLDGVAWTTAGRMIPLNRRVAFILTSLAMLIVFQMALWPVLIADSTDDNSVGRLIAGLLAIGMLTLLTGRVARRERSATHASLCVVFFLAAVIFLFVRMPPSPIRGWTIQYQAVVLSVLALPILTAAEALQGSRWTSFSTPLWWLSLLVLPAAALLNLLSPRALPAEWVKPMALAILGAVYAFAGNREHRRAFLVLGAALLVAAVTSLFHVYGAVPISTARGPGE